VTARTWCPSCSSAVRVVARVVVLPAPAAPATQHQGVIAGQRRGGLDLGRVHLDTRGRGRPGHLVGAGVPARYGIGRATRGEPARRSGR
jgi:hypothetical protein